MRRLSILSSAAILLVGGCELFPTWEIRARPASLSPLPGLEVPGDSVIFLATEAVWTAGARVPEAVLSRRRVAFRYEGDSLDGGDTLRILAMRIVEDSSGIPVEEGRRLVRFTPEGVELPGVPGGSARHYPLKAAAGDSGSAAAFMALPTLLIDGWSETVPLGVLTARRLLAGSDTLDYRGHGEETWLVEETIANGADVVCTGAFRYGASGLLRVDQEWDGFSWRGGSGEPLAAADDGATPSVVLRRTAVRL